MEKSETTIRAGTQHRFLLTTYAMPRFGFSLVLSLQSYVTFFIYTQVFNLPGILTGICSFVGYLAIAAAQFSMGTISDRTNTRWGRRRPYVIFGSPFLLLSFFMLFTPPLFLGSSPATIVLFVWMLAWNSGFEIFYGVTTTPYQAMLPEITEVGERPRASQLQNIWGLLGSAAGLVLTFVGVTAFTATIVETGQLNIPFLLIFLVSAIVTGCFLYFFVWKMPREQPKWGSHESIMSNLREAIRNKNFLRVTIFQGIASLVPTSSLALGFVSDVLHFNTLFYVLTALVLLFAVLIFYTVWRKFIERRGKKWTLQIILLFGMIIFPLSLIGLAQNAGGSILKISGIVFVALVAIFIAGWSLFPYILYADLTEDDARRTKNFKAGVYTGFPSIPLNIFQGVSIFITGALDTYLPTFLPATATTGSVSWYYIVWGPLATVYLLIAILYLHKKVVLDFTWEKEANAPGMRLESIITGGESDGAITSVTDILNARMQTASQMIENKDYDNALATLDNIRKDAEYENLTGIAEDANDRIDFIRKLLRDGQ